MFLEQAREAIQIVRQAIDLMASTPDSVGVSAELLKVMQAKDEGAFRGMQVTRAETAFVWRELEKTRNEVVNLQNTLSRSMNTETLTRAERDAVFASRSWRVTKPLRAIAARLRGQH